MSQSQSGTGTSELQRQYSYVDLDLYGRAFDGIFGPGAEEAGRRSALLRMKAYRDAHSAAWRGSFIEYDLYGRGDPRIFGKGAHLANAEQARQQMPHSREASLNKLFIKAIIAPAGRKIKSTASKIFARFRSQGKTSQESLDPQTSSEEENENKGSKKSIPTNLPTESSEEQTSQESIEHDVESGEKSDDDECVSSGHIVIFGGKKEGMETDEHEIHERTPAVDIARDDLEQEYISPEQESYVGKALSHSSDAEKTVVASAEIAAKVRAETPEARECTTSIEEEVTEIDDGHICSRNGSSSKLSDAYIADASSSQSSTGIEAITKLHSDNVYSSSNSSANGTFAASSSQLRSVSSSSGVKVKLSSQPSKKVSFNLESSGSSSTDRHVNSSGSSSMAFSSSKSSATSSKVLSENSSTTGEHVASCSSAGKSSAADSLGSSRTLKNSENSNYSEMVNSLAAVESVEEVAAGHPSEDTSPSVSNKSSGLEIEMSRDGNKDDTEASVATKSSGSVSGSLSSSSIMEETDSDLEVFSNNTSTVNSSKNTDTEEAVRGLNDSDTAVEEKDENFNSVGYHSSADKQGSSGLSERGDSSIVMGETQAGSSDEASNNQGAEIIASMDRTVGTGNEGSEESGSFHDALDSVPSSAYFFDGPSSSAAISSRNISLAQSSGDFSATNSGKITVTDSSSRYSHVASTEVDDDDDSDIFLPTLRSTEDQ